jgi:RNA polymerase sigma-70 factor (ECF subfamily)
MGMDQNDVVKILLRERVRLVGLALAICRDVHAAEDVFQQLVLRGLETNNRFREAEHVLAWALRTARHRAADVRGGRAQPLDSDVLDLLASDQAIAPSDGGDRAEALRCCLEGLPAVKREILRLRYEEGLAGAAVARRLKRTVDAVYQTLSRTHRDLRDCIERRLTAASSGGVR